MVNSKNDKSGVNMALISCPECGREISDRAVSCPGCGYPIQLLFKPWANLNVGERFTCGYEWRVLAVDRDANRSLTITEYTIARKPYHYILVGTTWERCSLRKWLNDEFFHSLPPVMYENAIEVVNQNHSNPWFGTPGGSATRDKAFLLSLDELVRYFGDSGKLGRGPTEYCYFSDQFNNDRIARHDRNIGWWWLRSQGGSDKHAADVHDDGSVNAYGYGVDNEGGVRPALWLNL
jgi:DNA-directed RNA polymerase subunit RPC12/RpoP